MRWLWPVLLAGAFFALTVLPLAPLDPFASSRVERLEGGGWRFSPPSLFCSDAEPAFLESAPFRQARFTVEVEARVTRLRAVDPARVVTYSRNDWPSTWNWGVCQARSALRLRRRGRHGNLRGVFERDRRVHLVVSYAGDRAAIHLDGAPAGEIRFGAPRGWAPNCRLVVANLLTGDRPLRGELFRLRIFDRTLDAEEIEALRAGALPDGARVLELRDAGGGGLELAGRGTPTIPLRRFDWPYVFKWRQTRWPDRVWLGDRIRNLLLTLPLGLALAAALRLARPWRSLAAVAGIQAALSLLAEGMQFFSATSRYPDWLDVAANTAGAVLGAAAWLWLRRRLRSARADA